MFIIHNFFVWTYFFCIYLGIPGTSSGFQNISEEIISDVQSSSSPFRKKKYDDISEWPFIDSATRDEIITGGPVSNQMSNENYPRKLDGRHFSNMHFERVMPNGETFKRRWLVYSKSADKVHCFCCRLFNTNPQSRLGKEGFDDWRHLSTRLKIHETSSDHRRAVNNWIEASIRLKNFSGIDKHLQKQIESEKTRWVAILERMMSIVFFLASNNLSFRGSSGAETLYTPNNGNFLGLVQLLGKFDIVMMEHLRRVVNKETNVHYFGKRIQNELIGLLASEVRNNILSMVKSAKYFSIILDCTPDVSHVEQLSVTFRFVDTNEEVEVRECFVAYKPVSDSSGAGLTGIFLDTIVQEFDLDMNDCRGQGYDNGANMVGINKGVQTRILNQYPRAFFNPCGCHSLNLVIADAAKTSVKSVSLFGFLQRLFVLFSGSTKRWEVVSKHIEGLSLKKVCETRWESRISSLAAVRYHYSSVRDALLNLHEETNDSVAASEALSLIQYMEQFEFIVTMVAWYDILFQVNIVSKAMQSESMDLPNASQLLKNCSEFVKQYRASSSALITAKEIASQAEIDPIFKAARSRRKKRLFEYEAVDETPSDPEELFKMNVFYPMIDTIENALVTRFKQLSIFNDTWSFLYNMKIIPERSILEKACSDLQISLTDGEKCDVSGCELVEELMSLNPLIKDLQSAEPLKVLQLIKKNDWQDIFPNVWTALRILLTIPVTVAKGERSFSKLKLIKTYLRSTMCQERLSDLGILSIENAIAQKLNYSELIKKFASAKARKVAI